MNTLEKKPITLLVQVCLNDKGDTFNSTAILQEKYEKSKVMTLEESKKFTLNAIKDIYDKVNTEFDLQLSEDIQPEEAKHDLDCAFDL